MASWVDMGGPALTGQSGEGLIGVTTMEKPFLEEFFLGTVAP